MFDCGFAGLPKAMVLLSILLTTTEPAPIIADEPIFTPCRTELPTPTHTQESIDTLPDK